MGRPQKQGFVDFHLNPSPEPVCFRPPFLGLAAEKARNERPLPLGCLAPIQNLEDSKREWQMIPEVHQELIPPKMGAHVIPSFCLGHVCPPDAPRIKNEGIPTDETEPRKSQVERGLGGLLLASGEPVLGSSKTTGSQMMCAAPFLQVNLRTWNNS